MAYEPKTWVCGETITAELLNNIEDGIEEALACCGGSEPLNLSIKGYETDTEFRLYLSPVGWQTINDAYENGEEINVTVEQSAKNLIKSFGYTLGDEATMMRVIHSTKYTVKVKVLFNGSERTIDFDADEPTHIPYLDLAGGVLG